jgi:predicted transcriptional regulator
MPQERAISAKAARFDSRSDSIVVSFGPEWRQSLIARRFSLVIRKRVPTNSKFKWLYFHINRPIGAIYARAPIERIFEATVSDAIRYATEIDLSPEKILNYIGQRSKVGCYKLGEFEFCREPITRSKLAERLSYFPPQSFFILDKTAKMIIDELAGFPSLIGTLKKVQLHV